MVQPASPGSFQSWNPSPLTSRNLKPVTVAVGCVISRSYSLTWPTLPLYTSMKYVWPATAANAARSTSVVVPLLVARMTPLASRTRRPRFVGLLAPVAAPVPAGMIARTSTGPVTPASSAKKSRSGRVMV